MLISFLPGLGALHKRIGFLRAASPLLLGVGTSVIIILLWSALVQQEHAQIQHALVVEANNLELEITE